jgi:hypothetical protein
MVVDGALSKKTLHAEILAKKILEINFQPKCLFWMLVMPLKKLQKDSANIIADTAEKIIGNF